jgi:hypothetical protein
VELSLGATEMTTSKSYVRQSTPGQPIEGQIRKVLARTLAGKTPQEIADELNTEHDNHDEWRDFNEPTKIC